MKILIGDFHVLDWQSSLFWPGIRVRINARTLHLRVLSDTKEILTFPKAKIVDTNEVLGSPFFS